jgi:hypothetical protein
LGICLCPQTACRDGQPTVPRTAGQESLSARVETHLRHDRSAGDAGHSQGAGGGWLISKCLRKSIARHASAHSLSWSAGAPHSSSELLRESEIGAVRARCRGSEIDPDQCRSRAARGGCGVVRKEGGMMLKDPSATRTVTCPLCGLRLDVAVGEHDVTLGYLLNRWRRQCLSTGLGSPSLCFASQQQFPELAALCSPPASRARLAHAGSTRPTSFGDRG